MRVLHIVYGCIPHQYIGGVSRVAYELSRAQVQLGHDVTVFTTNTNSYTSLMCVDGSRINSDGVRLSYFPIQNRRWSISKEMKDTLLREGASFDVVHGHSTFLALNRYAAQWKQKYQRPLFYHVHGALDPIVVNKGIIRQLRKRIYIQWIERANYAQANTLFALTENEAQQLKHYKISTPVVVIPNGVSIPPLNTRSDNAVRFLEKHKIPADKNVILYVGRIVPKKGLHLLISAFAEVQKALPNSILVITGDRNGDVTYVEKLDKLIEEKHLNYSVCWTDFLYGSELQAAYETATIFSHVTESEGMAMSVLEAMAAALATVVSTECYMNRAASAGALIECGYEVESIASTIISLLKSPELRMRMGMRAREYVARNHDWRVIADQITDVYGQHVRLCSGR